MDSNPHYCIFFISGVYYKEIKKTNSIYLEILKEGGAMVVIRECANINISTPLLILFQWKNGREAGNWSSWASQRTGDQDSRNIMNSGIDEASTWRTNIR